MAKESTAITPTNALNDYFGGIVGLSKQKLPFKCKCGATDTSIEEGSIAYREAIMSISDCYKHIRKNHREIIKNPAKPKQKKEEYV